MSRTPLCQTLLLALCVGLLLSGCRSDRVQVNSKDPRSPQFAYRLDEFALLQMTADDIQDLEKKKQYGTIYDDYGSPDFKKSISRRRFLIITNCVETYLGGLLEFDSTNLGFHRETLKDQPKPLDTLTRKSERSREAINEQMVFIGNGINFKLNSMFWIARDKNFLECVANSPLVEANSQPVPDEEAPPGEATTPEGAKTEQPATPGQETGQPGEIPATAEPGTVPTGTGTHTETAAPAQAPVQTLKPGELKQEAPAVKPAGAGAVIDTRPAPPSKPEKADEKPSAPVPAQPAAPAEEKPAEVTPDR